MTIIHVCINDEISSIRRYKCEVCQSEHLKSSIKGIKKYFGPTKIIGIGQVFCCKVSSNKSTSIIPVSYASSTCYWHCTYYTERRTTIPHCSHVTYWFTKNIRVAIRQSKPIKPTVLSSDEYQQTLDTYFWKENNLVTYTQFKKWFPKLLLPIEIPKILNYNRINSHLDYYLENKLCTELPMYWMSTETTHLFLYTTKQRAIFFSFIITINVINENVQINT